MGAHLAVHPSMLDIEFAQISDSGRVRDHNEDYLGHVAPANAESGRKSGWLFVLADGVGGHEKGEVASQMAVNSLLNGFRNAPAGEPPENLLARLVQAANTEVYESGRAASPGGIAMATTIVACALRFDRVAVAHVGDSRCYLIRRAEARALTRDHTVANEQVGLGLMSSRQAERASTRHVLSRAIGSDLFVNVDTCVHQLLPGDTLLLCSDGLHGSVTGKDIASVIHRAKTLDEAVRQLVEIANRRDGSDNISVQLIRVLGVERTGMYRGRPYRLR